jgi:CRISPR-associated protein Csy3
MAKAKKSSGVPGVLGFSRKLEASDGVFSGTTWDARGTTSVPIVVREKAVRGTIGNRFKTSGAMDPTKIDAAMENPNLQIVDIASLSSAHDTLAVTFTMRVLGNVDEPNACGSFDFRDNLMKIVGTYRDQFQFEELARRYVINLANGRFLWRNTVGALACEVRVQSDRDGVLTTSTFDAFDFSLGDFNVPENAKTEIDLLTDLVSESLSNDKPLLLTVTGFVRLGAGQEVFPSQELLLDKNKSKKSKTLYVVEGSAGMHSQKIGNAIRTIDTWYPDAAEVGPIAIETYGAVTTMGHAFRQPQQKVDFYTIFDKWSVDGEVPSVEQQHYVMAVLIRGGVFGSSSD